MKERPIIMSTESVRQILAENKTQTRRVIKPQPLKNEWGEDLGFTVGVYEFAKTDRNGESYPGPKQYGISSLDGEHGIICRCGMPGDRLWVRETFYRIPGMSEPYYRTDWDDYRALGIKWMTPLYMPRKYSRITLEVTSVRAERLQEISEIDAILEGCESREAYRKRWEEINGKRYPWSSNPLVWVIEFKKL